MTYIAVEGVIGVGKTTLARLLAPQWSAQSLLEIVEENPFLSQFYTDRRRYAFQTETFFLLSRYRQQQQVVQPALHTGHLVADYLLAKNRLFASLNLEGDEWELFCQVYQALAERVARPSLVVYLTADVDTLMQRIASRDRPFERNMEHTYIAALAAAYDAFFAAYVDSPMVTIATDRLDLVSDPEARQEVFGLIRAATEGYRQSPLDTVPGPMGSPPTG